MNRCNRIVNRLFKNEIIPNNNNSKIIIRNMSILSKRQIFDKPQELRPTSKSPNVNDNINSKDLSFEKKIEILREAERDRLIEEKRKEFEKMKKLTHGNQSIVADESVTSETDYELFKPNKKKESNVGIQLHDYSNLFGDIEFNEEEQKNIERLLQASLRNDKNEIAKLSKELILSDDPNNPQDDEYNNDKIKNTDPISKLMSGFSNNLGSEYVTRLLIEDYQNKHRADEFIANLISETPEWQDYNNEVLREVAKLEKQEISYQGEDSARVTKYWNLQRMKTVESIRRKHYKRVEAAILLKLQWNADLLEKNRVVEEDFLQKATGLTLDQLKKHRDYSHIWSDDHGDELFTEKNEFDNLVDNLVGQNTDSIPKQFKDIFKTSTKSLEAPNHKDHDFEYAMVEAKKEQQKQQQQQQQQQHQQPISQESTNQSISNSDEKKLSFSDIVKKNQEQEQQQQQKKHLDSNDFDLKSILDNMSKQKK
ncbi:hypothetical protein RB653_008786 [Dictyostelium firmibasis]|uniref:Uncharacterized protein n=1 Tax=Dictyostelium firmibasis TaxID=79012 RepID=A0AAN7TRL4_9MYCE